jgi:hypothetical protein
MKPYLFGIMTLMIIVSLSSIVSVVNASVTREFDYDYYETWAGQYQYKDFSFHVKMIIETETNESWKPNNKYQIDFVITLTFLNESRVDASTFKIHFYAPALTIDDYLFDSASSVYEIVRNETLVSQGQIGTITVKYSYGFPWNVQRLQVKSWIRFDAYDNVKGTILGGWTWNQPEPIWIDLVNIESLNTSNNINPLVYVGIGIVIGAVPVATYQIYKSRKTKQIIPPAKNP